jgi:hypothetical protein
VPTKIEREQINVGDRAVIEHLDAYTSPRLVEYHDADPCVRLEVAEMRRSDAALPASAKQMGQAARSRGVTIEAQYTVGEYDIMILSATQSDGLVAWLDANGYHEEQAKSGYQYLRPIQVAYESNKFMLPIRLGTLNAKGKQELYVYALTRTGRVETTNYRTVKLPSNFDVPEFVEDEFAEFYRAMFERQTIEHKERAVFLEYAWDMAWCDPCAADPLSEKELRSLGAFWLEDNRPDDKRIMPQPAQNVFVTRLHVRYDAEHFPEDLVFQETGDRQNYQGRYVIRHPWSCDLTQYHASVRDRQEREAQQLANLTGWDIAAIRDKITFAGGKRPDPEKEPWWRRLWQ